MKIRSTLLLLAGTFAALYFGAPAGLVLEAAAPSLSSAVLVRLRSHWYLSPLARLPASKLLPHDYSLAEALTDAPSFPVVVFQGTADEQTPISLLRPARAIPAGARLVPVPSGTHSDTYHLALKDYVDVALRMIRLGSTSGPEIIGDDYVMPGNWTGKVTLHHDKIAACLPDQILTIEVWDQS